MTTITRSSLDPASEVDPVLPAVRSWASEVDEVVVATPLGVLDEATVLELDQVLAERPGIPVVIDLDHCAVTSQAALLALDPARWGRPADLACLVCGRLTARRLVARAGVAARLAVFQRTADAVQALILSRAGYGRGWGAVPRASAASADGGLRHPSGRG